MAEGFDGFWYGCEVRHYSVADVWSDHFHTSAEVVWTKYAVLRETPKGVWLTPAPWGATNPDYARFSGPEGISRRMDLFVLGQALRQRACPTRELALADAIAKKERHVAGCRARLAAAEADLDLLRREGGRL